jgi:protein-S-isoprenylcysteine O-methyltransferase Ste14
MPIQHRGRRLLDACPTKKQVGRSNVIVHYLLLLLLGIAIVEAAKIGQRQSGSLLFKDWTIPLPAQVGQISFIGTGFATLLTVLNLALRGLGASFAIVLSQRPTMDWFYAWTRNPMVLGTLLSLVSMGLMFRSLFLVLWALLLVTPALIFMLKISEERELEIRFGSFYLEYKRRTPFLWPRPRRTAAS